MERLLDRTYIGYAWTLLAVRTAELRTKVRDRDIGASAIELAIITAVLAVAAAAVAAVILVVINNNKSKIQGVG